MNFEGFYLSGAGGASGGSGSHTKLTASEAIAWDSTMSFGKLCNASTSIDLEEK